MSPELRLITRYIGLLPGSIGERAELLGVRRETLSRWLSEAEGTAPAPAPGRAGRRRVGHPTPAHVARLVWLLQQHAADVVVALDELVAVVAERGAAEGEEDRGEQDRPRRRSQGWSSQH